MTQIRFNRQRTVSIPQSREVVGSQSVGNLKDITLNNLQQNDILAYNSLSSKFVNIPPADIQADLTEIDGGTY